MAASRFSGTDVNLTEGQMAVEAMSFVERDDYVLYFRINLESQVAWNSLASSFHWKLSSMPIAVILVIFIAMRISLSEWSSWSSQASKSSLMRDLTAVII
jgi:hypothetical protein